MFRIPSKVPRCWSPPHFVLFTTRIMFNPFAMNACRSWKGWQSRYVSQPRSAPICKINWSDLTFPTLKTELN